MNQEIKEHFAVLGVGFGSVTVTFADMEHAIRLFILIGSAIYVWRKALKVKRNKTEESED
jgi:hypothetical protein